MAASRKTLESIYTKNNLQKPTTLHKDQDLNISKTANATTADQRKSILAKLADDVAALADGLVNLDISDKENKTIRKNINNSLTSEKTNLQSI